MASFSFVGISQEEILSPLMTNPTLQSKQQPIQKIGNSIDSTFIYVMDTLSMPVWDDFSINKFVKYNATYTDGNVTSQWYYHLMNSTNTVPQNPTLIFCDSTHARHDTVSVVGGIGTTTSDYFIPNSVWVNDLSTYPVSGQLRTLYQECYVLIDSIIDGVPDPSQDTIYFTSSPDFVQDSANVFTVLVSDPNIVWADNFAYHNYTYAVNPWSLGVATLDGVDENGWPYDWGNLSAHEPADVLTSRPINLAGLTNVYLTFLYQAQGNGNAPELSDSLILDFWIPSFDAWQTSGWYSLGAITNNVWDTVHWPIPTVGLADGFRFRLRNWASTSGALDHWHIDYVNLKANDLPSVSNFSDLAISEPINTLLKDYTAVPWDHYKNAVSTEKMLDTARIKVYNSDLTPTNYANGELEVRFGGILQGGSPYVLMNPSISAEWTGNWELGINTYRYPVASNYSYNPAATSAAQAKFDVKLNIDAAVSGSNVYDVNDTTYYEQKFDNYYAYDDGSAEQAYGITGSHGKLAVKFTAYEEDTLTGILMHFVPSVDNTSADLFLLTVWEDNGGVPGNIIYQDDYFNTNHPEYSGAINGFRYYTFMNDQHIKVPQTFYVGWEQIESNSLNIGFDKNIDNKSKNFRNVTGTWQASSLPGTIMIRPVFSTALNYSLSEDEEIIDTQQEVIVFPNPTNGEINLMGLTQEFSVTIYDLSGRQVFQDLNQNQIDMSYLETGIYIVNVRSLSGEILHTTKVVKE